ncbi:hypothetical protein ACIRST_13850 [Kitasatospora sp. NPDC101447]|uniref:hypothetical protein n=1 Tax=Kitasatospora sp. NPDC101447 TaxID=3364102 RepID=UPI0037F1BCB4
MTQRRHEYAPPNTLPGLLQRGRGLGATMAAEDPAAAADLVYGCIRWEWRWDAALDDRHLYLARLVRDLELPLAPVVGMLAGDEGTRDRAAGVLALLARGGSAEARDALRAHLPPETQETPEAPEAPEAQEAGQGELRVVAPPDGPGDEPDVPALLAELERDWVDGTWCGPMRTARGLARAGAQAAGAISLLRRFWLWTPHSHERPSYLEALAALGSAGTAEAYAESLWDCEARARLLGVEHAPDRPDVRDRLARLRDDPMEHSAVRKAAATRLGGGSTAG